MRNLTEEERLDVTQALQMAKATLETLLKRYSLPGDAADTRYKHRIAKLEELVQLFKTAERVDVT